VGKPEEREPENNPQRKAIDRILKEREYQRERWGSAHDRGHTIEEWSNIITVYTGKVAATVEPYGRHMDKEAFKKRITQLAAICAAALEALE
jgi:hypothetical protein